MSPSDGRREFLVRSIADLDDEHAAGDLSDDDHRRLRADYQRRLDGLDGKVPAASAKGRPNASGAKAAAAPKAAPPRRSNAVVTTVGVLVVAVVAGFLLAGSVGRRGAGDNVTGIDLTTDEAAGAATTGTTLPAALEACVFEDDPGTAVDCYLAYRRDNPEEPQGLFHYGLFLISQGLLLDNDQLKGFGTELLQEAVDVAPDFYAARVNLATVLVRTGRVDEARQVMAPIEGQELPSDLQQLVDAIAPQLDAPPGPTTTSTTTP